MLADGLVGALVLTCMAIYHQNMTFGSSWVHAQDEPKTVTRPLRVYAKPQMGPMLLLCSTESL